MHEQALNHLVTEIKSSTSSMTAVPKPLKFLRPHYDSVKAVYERWNDDYALKTKLSDGTVINLLILGLVTLCVAAVLSVLSMTMAEPGSRQSLKYRLAGTREDISSWGHEYVRALSGEISEEYNSRSLEVPAENEVDVDDLIELVNVLVPYQMSHNAEAEAVDLLMEVQRLGKLADANVVDDRNYERVCLYLLRCADYVTDPDDLATLYHTAYELYKQQQVPFTS
jgi:26S proteasome regulatory subunit N1